MRIRSFPVRGWMVFHRTALGVVLLSSLLGAGSRPKSMVPQNRRFPLPYEEVWETVQAVLRREGWNIVRAEKGKGILQTDFYEFSSERFGPNVATDPPPLSWDYGIFHRIQLTQGRVKLKLSVRPSGGGTRVAVGSILEEPTVHRDERKFLWAPRESNGAIELYVLDRLEETFRDRQPGMETGSPAGS